LKIPSDKKILAKLITESRIKKLFQLNKVVHIGINRRLSNIEGQ
jgi:hypothetical protein